MTEGRCFLPGFDGDCKDGGSETKEWVKRGWWGGWGCFLLFLFFLRGKPRSHPTWALASALEIVAVFPGSATNPESRANTSSGSSYFTFSQN